MPIDAVRNHEIAKGLEGERQRTETCKVKTRLRQGGGLVEDMEDDVGGHEVQRPAVVVRDMKVDVLRVRR